MSETENEKEDSYRIEKYNYVYKRNITILSDKVWFISYDLKLLTNVSSFLAIVIKAMLQYARNHILW